jgi:hypothetical protein
VANAPWTIFLRLFSLQNMPDPSHAWPRSLVLMESPRLDTFFGRRYRGVKTVLFHV